MTAPRRNEVAVISGDDWIAGPQSKWPFRSTRFIAQNPEPLILPITHADACRLAAFELRTGAKIEQVLVDFLRDTIFALDDVPPAPSREQSTSR